MKPCLVVYVDTLAYRSVRHNFPNTFYFRWTLTCFDYSFVSNFVHWVSLLWVSNFFLQLSFIECRPVERLSGCMLYAWRPCVNHPLQYFCFEYSQENIARRFHADLTFLFFSFWIVFFSQQVAGNFSGKWGVSDVFNSLAKEFEILHFEIHRILNGIWIFIHPTMCRW